MSTKNNDPVAMKSLIVWCMRGETPFSLRALSFSFSPQSESGPGNVRLRAHFLSAPSEDDLDQIEEIVTLLYSHEYDYFEFVSEAQLTPRGIRMDLLPYTAYEHDIEAYR